MTLRSERARLLDQAYSRLKKAKRAELFLRVRGFYQRLGRSPGPRLRAFAVALTGEAVGRAGTPPSAVPRRLAPGRRRLEEEIGSLYRDLRRLARIPPTPETEVRYGTLLSRLRVLQDEEARRMGDTFRARAALDAGGLDRALRRADDLLHRHGTSSGDDAPGREPD
ncbi:MAG: hypothetical protein ACREIU_07435 [Planctomycetota bacterium]